MNNAKLAVSGENVFIQKTSIDLSPAIDSHKKNSARAGHLTVRYHGYLPLLLKSLITFLQCAESVPQSSAFPLTLRGFAGCCGVTYQRGAGAAGGCTAGDGKPLPLCRSKAVEVAPKYWKPKYCAPVLGVRRCKEGAGEVKEWLVLVAGVRCGLRTCKRRAEARAACWVCSWNLSWVGCGGWCKNVLQVSREKNTSKGESGLLEVRQVNCVDQIHTTPWNLWMKSIINLMFVLLKNDLWLSTGATHGQILKILKEVFYLTICWSFLYAFLMCCFLPLVDTAPAELAPRTNWNF